MATHSICEGASGRLFEITPDGATSSWEYFTAYSQFGAALRKETTPLATATFRAYRYAPDYAAFEGRDMTPGDPVEGNPHALRLRDSTLRPLTLLFQRLQTCHKNHVGWLSPTLRMAASPSTGLFQPGWSLSDSAGRIWAEGTVGAGHNSCSRPLAPPGMYVVTILRLSPAASSCCTCWTTRGLRINSPRRVDIPH